MRSDQDLRSAVERELEWEPRIDAGEIGVSVRDGVVTLSGFAHSYGDKFDAERAAKRVAGVLGLANDIEVRLRAVDKRTDGEIAQDAVSTLKNNTSIPEGKVRPVVKNGFVTLEGEVEWQFQRDAAERAVRRLRGVSAVGNQIKVKPSISPTASQIAVKIEDALKRSALLDARRITVETAGGTVTLKGSVRSLWELDEAEDAAWAAPGVTSVDNRLVVTAPV